VKAFKALAEHLQLAQKTQLLQLHIAEQSVRFRQMQDIEQESTVDRNLIGFPHAGSPSIVPSFLSGAL
jgi:hypothetical protein